MNIEVRHNLYAPQRAQILQGFERFGFSTHTQFYKQLQDSCKAPDEGWEIGNACWGIKKQVEHHLKGNTSPVSHYLSNAERDEMRDIIHACNSIQQDLERTN